MYNSLVEKIFQPDPCSPLLIEYVWIHVHVVLPFFCFFFSFLACVSGGLRLLFNVDFSTVNSVFMYCMYCSRTHKYHFLSTFSLKIGLIILFTHLKIILLQYFSVFNFQLSAESKRTLNSLQEEEQVFKPRNPYNIFKIIKYCSLEKREGEEQGVFKPSLPYAIFKKS